MPCRFDAPPSVPPRLGVAGGTALPSPFDALPLAQGKPTPRPAVQTIALDRLG